jgi:hypothetical protein
MISITNIMLDGLDGPLTAEQKGNCSSCRESVRELSEMVDDLLDAKVEAGRISISPEWFEMVDLFSALRGMFKPIVGAGSVALIFEKPSRSPHLLRRQALANFAQFHLSAEIRRTARFLLQPAC